MVMFSALFLLTLCAALRSSEAKNVEIFNEIQALLRARREVLGESSYECYSNGECVAEYKMDGLLTYKEEALCARSLEGCGEDILERRKREAMCTNMNEDLELCKRQNSGLCAGVLRRMEEEECEGLLQERRARVKRDECLALNKRFEQQCKRSAGKRAVNEECSFVLRAMEESECGSEGLFLEKRAKNNCDEGWSFRDGICYKYFSEPKNFGKAEKFCEGLTDGKSHLATIERMLASSAADRKFFSDLIHSSGAVKHIDSVLSTMDDMFEGKNWKEVIAYYDNWAWIGLQYVNDGFKWVSPVKAQNDWNSIKVGHADWRKGEPSKDNDFGVDNGNCVIYFQYSKTAIDSALADTTDVGDLGAWWNASCNLELPYLCEMDAN